MNTSWLETNRPFLKIVRNNAMELFEFFKSLYPNGTVPSVKFDSSLFLIPGNPDNLPIELSGKDAKFSAAFFEFVEVGFNFFLVYCFK
jgi:hypothetical protein